MRYLSVCSGIEAASAAFEHLGWKPLAFSEIEAFPRAVLAHHYPEVPIHGDFTELKTMPFIVDADLLCGGTPCQAFSVAGLRQSLSDDRGNLSLQFIHLADAIDDLRSTAGRDAAWILWENVPGLLSTSDNAFGAFLGGLCGRDAAIAEPSDGWPGAGVVDGPTRVVAWRVLDAQHFGLAQRRKRVFVLAKGGAGRWGAADALLPIVQSSGWHPAPGRGAGEGTSATVAPSPTASGRGVGRTGESRGQDPVVAVEVAFGGNNTSGPIDVATTISAHSGPHGRLDFSSETFIAHTLRGEGFDASEDGTGRGIPLVMAHGQSNAEVVSDGEPSLTCNHEPPILVRMREGKEGGGNGPLVSEDKSLTLATANDQVLAFRVGDHIQDTFHEPDGVMSTLKAGTHNNGGHLTKTRVGTQVRRLTPTECERLQGFPDGYTLIPWRKGMAPDGPRYKALGNSWAVPCAAYIGKRIQAVTQINTSNDNG